MLDLLFDTVAAIIVIVIFNFFKVYIENNF